MEKTSSPFSQYWEAYGGWRALFSSKYFWCSFIITPMCYSFWALKPDDFINMALAALPNLLGFALGGYAVWLGIGDQRLKKLLSEFDEDRSFQEKQSDFMIVNATFVHFIVLQIISLSYLIILKANSFSQIMLYLNKHFDINSCFLSLINLIAILGYGFGFLLFIYSIFSMLAATFAVFRIAKWSDELNRIPDD